MSSGISKSIPSEIKTILQGYKWKKNTIGCTKTSIFYCEKENYPSYFLKIANIEDNMNLNVESAKLIWAKDKLPVPEVLNYTKTEKHEFLLLSEIKGVPSHFLNNEDQKMRTVVLLAKGLRQIHSLDISECPFNNSLSFQVNYVKDRIKNGLIDEHNFDPVRRGRSINSLFKELLNTKPESEDLVFTHGDYCLPNVLIYNNQISGFIDFGLTGISDRYLDLGIGARSITYNFGKKWVPIFFEEYGLKTIDKGKIVFYQLLDEFY